MRVALSPLGFTSRIAGAIPRDWRGTALASGLAMTKHDHPSPLDIAELEAVSGGMKWEDLPPSANVEDRRNLSPRESMRVRSQPAPPLPPLVRTPGDLSSQAGLDDIGRRRR